MSLNSWLTSLKQSSRRRNRPRGKFIEGLEERALLTAVVFQGHAYEFIADYNHQIFAEVNAAAESMSYLGVSGHLATITSQAENEFLFDAFRQEVLDVAEANFDTFPQAWIGGHSPTESTDPNNGWEWTTGETWGFTDWRSGEPNGFSNSESSAVNMDFSALAIGGSNEFDGWNDVPQVWHNIEGYIVEWDISNTPPVFSAGAEQTFTILENSPGGTPVGISGATDADSDTLVYSITAASNPEGDGFAIDSNGQITIDNAASLDLDFDDGSPNVAVLTVNVNDGTEDVQQLVTVNVSNVTAQDLLCNLIDEVDGLVPADLTAKDAGKLTAKMQDAKDKLNDGKLKAGVNKIGSFINQLNAFVNSGKLTQAQADVLIDAANTAIAEAGEGGAALVTHVASGGSGSAGVQPITTAALLVTETLTVGLDGNLNADQQASFQAAISELNGKLGDYGVALVELDAQSSEQPDIQITVSASSPCGSAADGVLGCTAGGEITLISGWNWYTAAESGAIGADQYDFQTIVTHEVGHSVGLDHSGDANSVMFEMLATHETRRVLTAQDLVLIEAEATPSALLAAPTSGRNLNQLRQVVSVVAMVPYSFALAANFGDAASDSGRENGRLLSRSRGADISVFGDGNQDVAYPGIASLRKARVGRGDLFAVTRNTGQGDGEQDKLERLRARDSLLAELDAAELVLDSKLG